MLLLTQVACNLQIKVTRGLRWGQSGFLSCILPGTNHQKQGLSFDLINMDNMAQLKDSLPLSSRFYPSELFSPGGFTALIKKCLWSPIGSLSEGEERMWLSCRVLSVTQVQYILTDCQGCLKSGHFTAGCQEALPASFKGPCPRKAYKLQFGKGHCKWGRPAPAKVLSWNVSILI